MTDFDRSKQKMEPPAMTTAEFLAQFEDPLPDMRDGLREGRLRELLGKNIIGPEEYRNLLGVQDVGNVPPIPDLVTEELLNSVSPITRGLIKDTYRLVFIPSTLDGIDFTICNLKDRVKEIRAGEKVFYEPKDEPVWYRDRFANTPVSDGRWVLMPMGVPKETRGKNYQQQEEPLRAYSDYYTPQALEAVTVLIMNYLNKGEREFSDFWAFCADELGSGRHRSVGYFFAPGLRVLDGHADGRDGFLGRAVLRNIKASKE